MIAVTSNTTWTINMSAESDWCVPSVMSGEGNMSLKLTIAPNEGASRTAELTFVANGADPVVLKVVQDGAGGGESTGDVVKPDPASGITLDPEVPNADEACTIKFNPVSGNPLYNYSGELYAHLGVVVEGEWAFVPTEWGSTEEKIHFKNHPMSCIAS